MEKAEKHQQEALHCEYLEEDLKAIKDLEDWLNKQRKRKRKYVFAEEEGRLEGELIRLIEKDLSLEKEFFNDQHPADKGLYTANKRGVRKQGGSAGTVFRFYADTKQENMGGA